MHLPFFSALQRTNCCCSPISSTPKDILSSCSSMSTVSYLLFAPGVPSDLSASKISHVSTVYSSPRPILNTNDTSSPLSTKRHGNLLADVPSK